MRPITLTGAGGFLGWHIRAALKETGAETRVLGVGFRFDAAEASRAVSGVERLIHAAGVNRGSDSNVASLNRLFAEQVRTAITHADSPPGTVVYADSIQAGNGTVYGDAKAEAGGILRAAAEEVGADYESVILPNLFGEHGRPFYNAVTATFCHQLAEGDEPRVERDTPLRLLHSQDASDLLTGSVPRAAQPELETEITVSHLLERLRSFEDSYSRGEIPDIAEPFSRNLFNTYRSYVFEKRPSIALTPHRDDRGSFFEILRSGGGRGQVSFSTTAPGISRGGHFHRRKVERFAVLAGDASIRLRRVLTDRVVEIRATGDEPVAVDMPTMWSHNLTNTGRSTLFTAFWTDDPFDPGAPDTIVEAV